MTYPNDEQSKEVLMLIGTHKCKSTLNDVEEFLKAKFGDTNNFDKIKSFVRDRQLGFETALFCTEYDSDKINIYKASKLWLYSAILINLNCIAGLSLLFFVSQHNMDTIYAPAMLIGIGVGILGIVASSISLYYQNNSRLNKLNSFFKSQNVPVGSSDNSHSNIITNANL